MKNIAFILLTAVMLTACTANFEEINTNFNQAEEVSGALLLPTVIFDYANLAVNRNFDFGNTMGQYAANYEFNAVDIYQFTSDGRYWGIYSILQDVKDIETFGMENEDVNYEAIAIILRSLGISQLTDVYGDVPFSQATQAADGVLTPAYDTQESIYNAVMDDLKRASDLIDVNATVAGDNLFGGDMDAWKRFANSLRLRMLLRSSNAQDNKVAMQEIVDNSSQYPVFESNDHHAVYQYSGSLPDISPYSLGVGRDYDYYLGVPTTHLINTLLDLDDPRLQEWFDPKAGTTDYIGTAPGQTIGDIGRPGDFASKAASFFNISDKITGIFLSASEVQFILAEAVQAGMITGDAKTYYENGVSLSFDQWSVDMPADYLTTTAPYSDSDETLATQKWLSLYNNSVQGWLDWKRTGLPSFIQAGPGNVNGDKIPVRLMYPALEQSVNGSNYQDAASNIGGDDINSRVWWDK
ncbi:MAG: SusD/RagB family nutrient-binding outer membrane lipoprotein [Bacteroidota bacterium]